MSRLLQGQGVAGSVEKLKRHLAGGSGSGGRFKLMLLRTDEAAKVRFLDDPEEFMIYYEHYDRGRKAFVPAIENDPLASHSDDEIKRTSEKYLANVLNLDNGQVQLIKMTRDLSNRLLMRFQKNGTLKDRAYEIMRSGQGFDTTYDVEAGDKSDLDLDQFKSKMIDKEQYLLEQVDAYYGTHHVEEYLEGKGESTQTYDAPLAEKEVAPPTKTQAELDAENPLLDDDEREDMPAWLKEDVEDPWIIAKSEGLPCSKGPDGLCQICSHDVENCIVKAS